jgi:hypothetical protein
MTNILTVAENLKDAGFSEAQATALTCAIEAAAPPGPNSWPPE